MAAHEKVSYSIFEYLLYLKTTTKLPLTGDIDGHEKDQKL